MSAAPPEESTGVNTTTGERAICSSGVNAQSRWMCGRFTATTAPSEVATATWELRWRRPIAGATLRKGTTGLDSPPGALCPPCEARAPSSLTPQERRGRLGDDDGVHAAARHLEHGETAGDGVEKSRTGPEDVAAEAELACVARAEDERLAALLLRASLDGDDGRGAIEAIGDVAEAGLEGGGRGGGWWGSSRVSGAGRRRSSADGPRARSKDGRTRMDLENLT